MGKIVFAIFCVIIMLCIAHIQRQPKPIYVQMIPVTEAVTVVDPVIVNPLDVKNDKIKSFCSENVTLTIDQGYSMSIKLKAKLYFEKEKKFRLLGRFLGVLECDLGSNDTDFWFWSKKMKPPGLYYATHTNINSTRLKTPFNPNSIIESLGFNHLNMQNTTIKEDDVFLAITQEKTTILKQKVKQTTLINKQKNIVIGSYLHDLADKLIVSSETTDFFYRQGMYLPKTIEIIWPEESVKLTMNFNEVYINQTILLDTWVMPNYQPKINMASP